MNSAKLHDHGARRYKRKTSQTSNSFLKRLVAANCICKKGRITNTGISSKNPAKPSGGAFQPTANNVTGTANQMSAPTAPRRPSQKKYHGRASVMKVHTPSRARLTGLP